MRKFPPNRLRHYREKEKMWSRAELAELAKVSESVITKIENCTTNPSLSTRRRIIEALGLKIGEAELVFPKYED